MKKSITFYVNNKCRNITKNMFALLAICLSAVPALSQTVVDADSVRSTAIVAHRGFWQTEGSAQNSLTPQTTENK